MDYNLIDLLEILKDVEIRFETLYRNISVMNGNNNMQFKTAAKILSGEEKRHAEDYANLIEKINSEEDIKINRELYANAFGLLEKFQQGITKANLSNTNELIEFAVKYEKQNACLLQEILLQMENTAMDIRAVELFQKLIVIEEKHSATLNQFLNKK